MPGLPTGTVTFLFTDLEGSTRLWEEHPDAMRAALARHDEMLRAAVESCGGVVVKTTGDGLHAAFRSAEGALEAAASGQRALAAEPWQGIEPLRVRMGVHTGGAEARDGDYFGPALNRAARLMQAAHGGQVLVSLATEELVRDSLRDVGLLSLGEHRLRDLSRPERVFQLTGGGLAGEFAPLRTLDSFPGNLPLQVTSFVGRRAELDEILAALESSHVLTLTGVGGVGKTRLALQAAAEALPRFPAGAWLIELGPLGDPEAVLEAAAAALGVQQHQGRSLGDSLVEAMRTKTALLVLDNCEHLLDASADLVGRLIRACPEVRVLATSREALDVPGERAKRLRSLPVPRAGEDVERLAASDAVRLFVDRAQEVRAGFVLEAGVADSVVQICSRLDGIPLAIELAAARMASMQPADIAARLDERFRLLTGGRRTAVERHHTLRATVDWSYELLSADEQAVFDRLAVFAGGFSLAAAEEVVSGNGVERHGVLDRLDGLVARSMVALDESAAATRYELLETMRQYARERLEAGDADVWRRGHGRYFASLAELAGALLSGPDELAGRAQLREELDNLRTAVTWALDSREPSDGEVALRIVAALGNEAVGNAQIGIGTWAQRAAARSSETTPGRRTAVLGAAANFAVQTGDTVRARELALESLDRGLPPDCPWPYLPYLALGLADMYEGHPEHAHEALCAIRRELEVSGIDPFTMAILTILVATWALSRADYATGRREAERGIELARATGSPTCIAAAEATLGWAFITQDPDRALAALEASIAAMRAGANDSAYAAALGLAAIIRARRKDPIGSLTDLRNAIEHCHRDGLIPNMAGILEFGIQVFAELGHPEGAAVLAGVVHMGCLSAVTISPVSAGVARSDVLEVLRAALDSDIYDRALTHGSRLSYDQAVDYALHETAQLLTCGPEHRSTEISFATTPV